MANCGRSRRHFQFTALLAVAFLAYATSQTTCPLTATELSKAPSTIAASPILIGFVASFTDATLVASSFRTEVAAHFSIDAHRVCVSNIGTTGTPAYLGATVYFLPNFAIAGDGGTTATTLQTQLFTDASAGYDSGSLKAGAVGQYIDKTKTTAPFGINLRRCNDTSRYQEPTMPCADKEPVTNKPSVNDSVTPLAWGLAGGIVAVNIISAYIMWHGYTRYEEEATAKQDEKIQSKLARLQAQGELRSSLMDMDQPLSSGGSPAMGPGQYAYATGHYSLPPRQ